MTYLFNTLRPSMKAHIWDGNDTACRLWSTGGIRQNRPGWTLHSTPQARLVCHMCLINSGQPLPTAQPQYLPRPLELAVP